MNRQQRLSYTRKLRRVSEDALALVRKHNPALRWFHGGAPDFEVGSKLLPPRKTALDPRGVGGRFRLREAFVYMTTDYSEAFMYARAWPGGGMVWAIEPFGEILLDRGWLEESWHLPSAFCCRSAKIQALVSGPHLPSDPLPLPSDPLPLPSDRVVAPVSGPHC